MTLAKVIQSIRKCELESKRDVGEVTLIAVSKVQPVEKIEKVLTAGHKHFGENRVQEAWSKWPMLKEQYEDVKLHLLGPLQTNKVDQAVRIFDVIHSLDRERLAEKLASSMKKLNKDVELFVQVNFENEEQKSGIRVNDLEKFLRVCVDKYNLNIIGLMCIPPMHKDPKSFFIELKSLAKENNLPKLSMGMSSDYQDAVYNGATHVRVGTAIFGERN